MSFDENPKSPDQLVDPAKRTTKVNFGVVGGVLLFLILGAIALWIFARNQPPDEPADAPSPLSQGFLHTPTVLHDDRKSGCEIVHQLQVG